MISAKTTGLRRFSRRVIDARKAARDTDAGLEVIGTRGTSYGRKKSTEAQKPTLGAMQKAAHKSEGMREGWRSPAANLRIWNKHKADGRNPFVFNRNKGRALWIRGAMKAVRFSPTAMNDAGERVANYMLDETNNNIDSGRGVRPNTGRYAEWKRKRFPGKPALELSGQLRASLKPKVIQSGRR